MKTLETLAGEETKKSEIGELKRIESEMNNDRIIMKLILIAGAVLVPIMSGYALVTKGAGKALYIAGATSLGYLLPLAVVSAEYYSLKHRHSDLIKRSRQL